MKKRMLALTLTALMLSGCGADTTPETTAAPTVAVTEAATEAETTEATRFTQPAETLPDPTEETVELSYSAYKVTYTYLRDNGEEFYTFQGIDPEGNVAWTHETAHLGMAQIQRVMPIGTWEDRFFYNEDGTVVALDLVTGQELWRNEEFGGCFSIETAAVIDPEGFLYLCGADTPDFFVCDVDGNTILRINGFENRTGAAYAMERRGDELFVISEDGDGTVYNVVPMTWLPQAQG